MPPRPTSPGRRSSDTPAPTSPATAGFVSPFSAPAPAPVSFEGVSFAVVILTAPPPGQMSEAGGAMMRIDGRETVLRASDLFLNRPEIHQILAVFEPADLDDIRQRIGSHLAFAGIKIVPGGPKWLDQVAAAHEKLNPDITHVILHDGARCCVPFSDVDAILAETVGAPSAVGLVAPLRSTVLELDDKGAPAAYHLPDRFVQLLTPQGFTRKAFDDMAKSKKEVHAADIRVVKGSPLNLRVGGPGDDKLIKTLLAMLPKPLKANDSPFNEAQW